MKLYFDFKGLILECDKRGTYGFVVDHLPEGEYLRKPTPFMGMTLDSAIHYGWPLTRERKLDGQYRIFHGEDFTSYVIQKVARLFPANSRYYAEGDRKVIIVSDKDTNQMIGFMMPCIPLDL